MTLVSFGDMAQSSMMRRMTSSAKSDALIAAQELTTGIAADIGQKMRGEFSNLTGIEASLSRLGGYKTVTDNATLIADSMQKVFAHIDLLTDGVSAPLLNATTLENTNTLDALAHDAAQRLDSVIAALNTKAGDSTLFAGVESDGPALASSDVILSALEAAISGDGAVTADEIEASVTAWFESPTGYSAVAYVGGNGTSAIAISAEDKVDLAFTANDPTLRDTIKSLALVALVDRGTATADPDIKTDLARKAGNSLLQNQADRAVLAGRLGLAQAQIDQAQTRNTAETSALNIARSDLLSVDPYEAATRLEASQSQLETLYSITARLSRLSLVDYL
ncbi:flagellar biosynthesis protein FlgL [Pseudorhodobacter turbinis]|uniref:Flagellar biosynthesis protein FlgL n=1 Tax=Pseudorhodobacter turbinis TaxID=2500533 RepID=A0A4V1E0V1_9RHOB|nr:flagellin [Pseudorhodobacter turbinis]QCO55914.1 flagellar biosynthesis protein FlgL [Pseudorhodobacter turbinis]